MCDHAIPSPHQAGRLVNPPQQTRYKDKLVQLSEAGYATRRTAPLGRSHAQGAGLPKWYGDATTFGLKSVSSKYKKPLNHRESII